MTWMPFYLSPAEVQALDSPALLGFESNLVELIDTIDITTSCANRVATRQVVVRYFNVDGYVLVQIIDCGRNAKVGIDAIFQVDGDTLTPLRYDARNSRLVNLSYLSMRFGLRVAKLRELIFRHLP